MRALESPQLKNSVRIVGISRHVQYLILNVVGQNYFVQRKFRLLRNKNFVRRIIPSPQSLVPRPYTFRINGHKNFSLPSFQQRPIFCAVHVDSQRHGEFNDVFH